ncbi:hypothetical protein [Vibrio quintilis]|uniref:Glycosyltransferase RgtA/B/C/D-like domain-containing protein n=1 Tax=Vibrio quintilis TaxID=1117707 RepID=A0A1M7YSN0_9VIBR|nr:hypothetical protein [Vibrio quintilis]SHO55536.1 hypothetical protein VQ7734_01272 [Vibrio quintilis]
MLNLFNTSADNTVSVSDTGDRLSRYILLILLLIFALFSFRYQFLLLNFQQWGDESETIVTAKMMAAGIKLYSEIFNHHGPLTFLPGLIVEKTGDYSINVHRIPIALLQIMAVFSVYRSPIIKGTWQRVIISIVVSTVMLIYMPRIFGHTYIYQTLAGLLLIVLLSLYALPSIFEPESLHKSHIVTGNILIASLPFLAVTYAPTAILLFFLSLRMTYIRTAFLAGFLGFALNILFLGLYGSYPGYLAFHIYLNAEILPYYTGLQPGFQLIVNALKAIISTKAQVISLVVMLISTFILARKEQGFPWRTLLLLGGFGSLLMRGSGFQGLPYMYGTLALFIPLLGRIKINSLPSQCIVIGMIVFAIVKVSLLLPGNKQKILLHTIPYETEFSRFVQDVTNKNDRIIAFSFKNLEYIYSDRLPASGNFFYFPWQEKYNEHPKFGVMIDTCKQIKQVQPKVMYISKWNVWGRYPWNSYAGCIQQYMDSSYYQIPGKPYYVRKDLVNENGFDRLFKQPHYRKMRPSVPLDENSPVQLMFAPEPVQLIVPQQQQPDISALRLTGVGIMFDTYNRTNQGSAELLLKRAGASDLTVDISLQDLKDNHYHYFDLPEGIYTSGKVISVTGNGVSIWESHSERGETLTCMKYYYSDGSRAYTPGCPVF